MIAANRKLSVDEKRTIPEPPSTRNVAPVAAASAIKVVLVIAVVPEVFCRKIADCPAPWTSTSLMEVLVAPLLKMPLPVGLSIMKPEKVLLFAIVTALPAELPIVGRSRFGLAAKVGESGSVSWSGFPSARTVTEVSVLRFV